MAQESGANERQEMHLKRRIKEAFEESRGTYGPDRITAKLCKEGERIGRKKCAEYMADMQLDPCHNRHRAKSLTNSKKARGDGYPNILRNQEFPIVARMGIASDITYLKTGEGFMYHCVIKDIVSCKVLGDHMVDRMTKELVINAILAMLARHELPKGCIFHSDRGSQFTSHDFRESLAKHGAIQGMSGTGRCYDNARMESFFATLKKEKLYRLKTERYPMAYIKTVIFRYVMIYYNRCQREFKDKQAKVKELLENEYEDYGSGHPDDQWTAV